MRKMYAVILCLSFSVLLILGSSVHAAPGDSSEISFSLPFHCETERGYSTRCLADAFKPGLSVVLVGKMGVCRAKTVDAFPYEHHVEDFEATHLSGTEECFAVKDNKRLFSSFRMAVVGADPAAVRLVALKDDTSPVPQEMQLKARKLAVPRIEEPKRVIDMTPVPVRLSDSDPKVLRAKNVTLLIFELLADGDPWEPGPTVALINGAAFRLAGACTYGEPIFFTVNDKLHLTYTATVACCGCGDTNFFVYDLSSGTPKLVYHNSSFSD